MQLHQMFYIFYSLAAIFLKLWKNYYLFQFTLQKDVVGKMYSKVKETKGVAQTHYLKLNCTVLSLFCPSTM